MSLYVRLDVLVKGIILEEFIQAISIFVCSIILYEDKILRYIYLF